MKLGLSKKRQLKRQSRSEIFVSPSARACVTKGAGGFKIDLSGLPSACLLSDAFLGRSLSNDVCALATSALTVKTSFFPHTAVVIGVTQSAKFSSFREGEGYFFYTNFLCFVGLLGTYAMIPCKIVSEHLARLRAPFP